MEIIETNGAWIRRVVMMKSVCSLIPVILLTAQCWVMGTGGDAGGDGKGDSMLKMLGLTAAFSIRDVATNSQGSGIANESTTLQLAPVNLIGADRVNPVVTIGADDTNLYLGTSHSIVAYNRATGTNTWLGGGTAQSESIFRYPQDFAWDNGYLYFGGGGQIQRLFTGSDGKGAIETAVPYSQIGGSNGVRGLSTNSRTAFWVAYNGSYDIVMARSLTQAGPPQSLLTIPNEVTIRASESALYVMVLPRPGNGAVLRYDLATGTITVIQAGLSLAPYYRIPNAISGGRFFWASGSNIYSVSHTATVPELVAAGIPNVREISVEGNQLLALQYEYASSPSKIFRVDLPTGVVTQAASGAGHGALRTVLRHGGVSYWATPWALYKLNSDGSTSALYSQDPVSSSTPIGATGDATLIGVGDRIILAFGSSSHLLSHDITTGVNNIIEPASLRCGRDCLSTDGTWIYAGSGAGIYRIPSDLRLRSADQVTQGPVSSHQWLIDGDSIYWSGRDGANPDGIFRAGKDGSARQQLFAGPHRGLILYNDRLYFTCNSCTTVPGWVIASIPKEGGAVIPEVGLGLEPGKLVRKGDIFYITDRLAGTPWLLFALNMPLQQAAVVGEVGGNDYDLSVSDKYVYAISSGWTMRFKTKAWDSYSSRQTIPISSNAIHFSGNSLYWWDSTKGLQKIDE
ncbi:MAG: hypothetical protein JNM27_00235 [Leptospirales bacterium]|nr:hypothetical protein [Leptospirales bacterium]